MDNFFRANERKNPIPLRRWVRKACKIKNEPIRMFLCGVEVVIC